MNKLLLSLVLFSLTIPLKAWWDPGHLVTAMIAYQFLDDKAKDRVDELTQVLQRDYPYLNHFSTLGPWPDDLKAEGVRSFDTWHYTNLPVNPSRIALAEAPPVDIIWAINQMNRVLRGNRPRPIEKARHLAFLVHLVADLHQPLHSTSVHSNDQPGGNIGGNAFPLEGNWSNLHSLWDDGCGYLSGYNDINPYGEEKESLNAQEINRLEQLAASLMQEFPQSYFPNINQLDPDFWALESHKLAIRYGYRGVNEITEEGRRLWIQHEDTPSELYLKNGQQIVKERLTLGGYRLAAMLNRLFGEN